MILFGNIILLFIVLYFASIQIEKYNQIILDKYRFSYFALRDRLAVLVVEGKLKEDSWEYDKIISAINFHIKAVEDISINKVISALIKYHNSPEEKKYVRSIQKGPVNAVLCDIMGDYLDLTHSLLLRNSKMQMKILSLIAGMNRTTDFMKERKTAIDNVGTYRDSFREAQFA